MALAFWGDQVTVSEDSNARSSSIATLSNDEFVIAYQTKFGQEDSYLAGKAYSPLGHYKASLPISTFVTVNQYSPQLAEIKYGVVSLSYIETYSDFTPIFTEQRFDAKSNSRVQPASINQSGQNPWIYESEKTRDGKFAILTSKSEGSSDSLYLTEYNAQETNTISQVKVGAIISSSGLDADFSVLDDGKLVVTWGTRAAPSFEPEIFTKIYNPDFTVYQGQTRIAYSSNVAFPVVEAYSAGFVVAWQDITAGGIYHQTYSYEGTPKGALRFIPSAGALLPQITETERGYIIAWEYSDINKFEADGSADYDITVREFSETGNQIGGALNINNPGDQFLQDMQTLDDGRVVLTFSNETGDSTNRDNLVYQIIDPRSDGIIASSGDDTIVARMDGGYINGFYGSDTLIGMSGDDEFFGWDGIDRLYGGAGHDTASFYLDRASYTVTQTNSLVTVRALTGGEAMDYISSFETLHFRDQDIRALGLLGDFDGDGRADLALQSRSALGTWFMNGENVLAGSTLPTLGKGWTAVGVGDASGDGRSDLLLQNGQKLATWLMSGDKVVGGGDIATLGDGWMVAGMADVDGNGRSDILLQNDRAVAVWQLDGSKLVGGGDIATLGQGWQIAGVGDLNGDGRADLLLQFGRDLAVWQLNGSQLTSGGVIGSLGSGWGVAGMGDFDGNGRSDILLQNGQQLAIWQVNGTQFESGGNVAVMAGGWSVSGLGDLNGDHKTDILLQNGQTLGTWTMNGLQIVSGATVSAQLAPGWELA